MTEVLLHTRPYCMLKMTLNIVVRELLIQIDTNPFEKRESAAKLKLILFHKIFFLLAIIRVVMFAFLIVQIAQRTFFILKRETLASWKSVLRVNFLLYFKTAASIKTLFRCLTLKANREEGNMEKKGKKEKVKARLAFVEVARL